MSLRTRDFSDGVSSSTAPTFTDAILPTTTKGDVIVHDGTNNQRLPVGADGTALLADSAEALGVKYGAVIGGGSGSGCGSIEWHLHSDGGPIEQTQFNEKVFEFADGAGQKLVAYVKVCAGYTPGNPLTLKILQYSPSASDTMLFTALTTLIRVGTDAIDTSTNQHTSTNSAITNTLANQARGVTLDLDDSGNGEINSVSVGANDILRIEISRGAGTDTADIRFVPNGTEIVLS